MYSNTHTRYRFLFLLFSSVSHSSISIVPPTPPPHLDHSFLSRSGVKHYIFSIIYTVKVSKLLTEAQLTLLFDLQDFKNSQPFTKSLEDLMVTFTSQIKSKFTCHEIQPVNTLVGRISCNTSAGGYRDGI